MRLKLSLQMKIHSRELLSVWKVNQFSSGNSCSTTTTFEMGMHLQQILLQLSSVLMRQQEWLRVRSIPSSGFSESSTYPGQTFHASVSSAHLNKKFEKRRKIWASSACPMLLYLFRRCFKRESIVFMQSLVGRCGYECKVWDEALKGVLQLQQGWEFFERCWWLESASCDFFLQSNYWTTRVYAIC